MNITSLLYPTDRIIGLEISNQYIKAILLEKNKQGVFMRAQKFLDLPEGILKDGNIEDKQKLAEILKRFWIENKKVFKTKKAMISVPPDFVFTYILEFPNLDYESLKKALELSLTSETIFPVKLEDIYYGWERMPEIFPEKSQTLLAFALKKKMDGYIETMRLAGIDAMIFEEPALSVARAVDGFADENPGIIANILSNGVNFGIIYKNRLRFSRFVNIPAVSSQEEFNGFIETELSKIVNFYDNDKKAIGKIKNILLLFPYKEKDALIDYLKPKFNLSFTGVSLKDGTPKDIAEKIDDFWLSTFGVATRALIPRDEDKDISLTPFSAEESFKSERMMSYFSLWGDLLSVVLIFFAILFLAGMFFMNILFDQINVKLLDLKIGVPITKEMTETAKEADRFNALVQRVSEIEVKKTDLQTSLDGIIDIVPKGSVQPVSISFTDETSQVSFKVIAQNPEAAFALRDALLASEKFADVKMPVLGIDQRSDIAFTITFKLTQL